MSINTTTSREARRANPTMQDEIDALGPWFHNLHLPSGLQTAPEHALGDFPANKWETIATAIPKNLAGWSVLDVGCNAGFYSFELARRGAQVTAIDVDLHYLEQARWAAGVMGLEHCVQFHQRHVYDLAHRNEQYDLVWFMGVFYHLRYPILGLDILARRTKRMMVFQTLTAPGDDVYRPADNLKLDERQQMLEPGWPTMHFIERQLANDPTNWWAANHACVEAMLRSAGLRVVERPSHEVYICEPHPADDLGITHLLEAEYLAATGTTRADHRR